MIYNILNYQRNKTVYTIVELESSKEFKNMDINYQKMEMKI